MQRTRFALSVRERHLQFSCCVYSIAAAIQSISNMHTSGLLIPLSGYCSAIIAGDVMRNWFDCGLTSVI